MIKNSLFLVFIFALIFNISAQNLISADSLKKHVYFLASDSLKGRGLGTPEGLISAKYIANYFQEFGVKPLTDSYLNAFYYNIGQTVVQGNNVIGIIEGADPVLKNEYILLGAHYDHVAFRFKNNEKVIYNGADDNATGTAAVIELGRKLFENKDQLKRSIILVAFDGEESGLVGSYKFVHDAKIPMEQVRLMMSIDMIGKYDRSNSLIMGAMGTLISGNEVLKQVAQSHNIKIKETGKKVSNRTDSKPFGLEAIPALHVTSGIIQPYHKPEDDPSDIDYKGMEKITNLLYDLTVELANKPELNPIKKLVRAKKQGAVPLLRFGLKANIGSSYHYYPNEVYNSKKGYSAELGIFTQLKISNYVALQPELLFSRIRTQHELGIFRKYNITTPISLVLSSKMTPLYEQRAYLLLGAYYSYGFAGKVGSNDMNFASDFEPDDYGLNLAVGMETFGMHLNFNYKLGMVELNKDNNLEPFRTRAAYLTIGYTF